MPDMVTASVQRRKVIHRLAYSLECSFVLDGRGVVTLPLMV